MLTISEVKSVPINLQEKVRLCVCKGGGGGEVEGWSMKGGPWGWKGGPWTTLSLNFSFFLVFCFYKKY